MPQKHISIITGPDKYANSLLYWMSSCWVEQGHEVHLVSDLKSEVDSDIVFLHVDITHLSRQYLDLAERGRIVVNGQCKSISKELFSSQMVTKETQYKGKVIVKTKANYGGKPEFYSKRFGRRRIQIAERMLERALSKKVNSGFLNYLLWKHISMLDPGRYPVFDSIGDVPTGVWSNSRLIVEKFMPEFNNEGQYVLRHWFFLGAREFSRILRTRASIQKWETIT